MVFKTFLLKYGEIGIKGKNRGQFEDALVTQVRHALSKVEGEYEVSKEQGRIYVNVQGDDNSFDPDEAVEALQKVFGLVGICQVLKAPVADPDVIAEDAVRYMAKTYGLAPAQGSAGAPGEEILPDADTSVQEEDLSVEEAPVREFTPSPAGTVTDTFERPEPIVDPEVGKTDTSGDMFTTIEDPMEWRINKNNPKEDSVDEPMEEKPPVSYLEGASSSGYQVENVAFGDISVGVETESVEYSVGHPLLRLLRNIL
jgi:hypothetical protein